MKIAILLVAADPAQGGRERLAWDWARWAAGRGHEIHLVALYGAEPPPGIQLHRIGQRGDNPISRAERLSAMAASLSADVVHDFGDGLGGVIFHPVSGSRAAGCDGELHALDPLRQLKWHLSPSLRHRRALRDELERRQLRHQRGLIVACSDRVVRDLQEAGAEPARIQLIYNAVDHRRFVPATPERKRALRRVLSLPPDDVLFLQVAQNYRLKGVRSSIRAVAHLARQGIACQLVVAGRGPNIDDYRRLAARLDVAGRCHFLGLVADTQPLYAAADALLHPTFYDACSLVTLEAWASGLPVALSHLDGASGLMTDGVQGWLIRDPRDAAEVSFRMKELLDAGRREAMGAQARVLAEYNTQEKCFSALEALCREAAARR